jgi:FKBP12-rapamycin complex-associated protein
MIGTWLAFDFHRWVPNCDTLHALIREYREARKIPLNWEHRLMLGMAPDYDHLPLINKVRLCKLLLLAALPQMLTSINWVPGNLFPFHAL